MSYVIWGGLVVAVSVEGLAEGERDRSTRLLEERSKVPEKEVTAKIKRERE